MLASMRTTASSFFMKLLMILLVISFAVWGVGDILRTGRSGGDLAKVGNASVSYPEFARGVSRAERMLQSMGMQAPDRRLLEDQVLRSLIEERILDQRLHDAGLAVNQTLLASRLRAARSFHDVQGKFDPQLFRATLQQQQMSESAFLSEIAADVRASLIRASLSVEGLSPPAALGALAQAADNERRDVVLITIPASAVDIKAPDEDALKAYYEVNKELLYQQPERRSLEYVSFSGKELEALGDKQVTSEMIADRIAEDPDRFAKDGEKTARAELRAEAMETITDDITTKIEDALAAGDTMGQAISKAGISATPKQLKDVTAGQYAQSKDTLSAAVAARGFALEENETSSLETSSDGQYFMVTAKSITPATPKPLETVIADVKQRAGARARNKAMREKAEEIKAVLEKNDDWQAALKPFGVSGRTVSNLSRHDKTLNPALAEALFEHKVGGVAGPLIGGDSAQLAKVTGASVPALKAAPDPAALKALAASLQDEVFNGYYRSLAQRYPITVNEKLLQEIRAQDEQS